MSWALSPELYAGWTLDRASVSSQGLSPSGMTVEEFQERAVAENGIFVVREGEGGNREVGGETKYYHDAGGLLALGPVDLDVRGQTYSQSKRAELC